MTLRVEFSAGGSFADCCRRAQDLMKLLPPVVAVSFKANLIECTVYADTDPEEFDIQVKNAQRVGKSHVIGAVIL